MRANLDMYVQKHRGRNILLLCLIVFIGIAGASDGTGDYIHYRLGVKYKSEKKYDKAIEEFRKVLAAYPDNYNSYYHMAEIRELQGQPRLTIFNLKKALSYNPGWSKAQKMLASAYEKDGQYQKAIIELQQYQQTGDPAERDSVQRQIDRMISLVSKKGAPESAAPAEPAGDTLENAKKPEGGIPAQASAKDVKSKPPVKQKPKSAGPASEAVNLQFNHAVELYNEEKFDEALAALRSVLAIDQGHSGAYYYAGLIRYRKKQNSHAVINLQKGLMYAEFGHNAHYYLGKIYGEEKQYAKAITHLFTYIERTTYEPGRKEAQQLIDEYRKKGGTAVLDAIAPGIQPLQKTVPLDTAAPREQYYSLEVRVDSLLTMVTGDTLTDAGRKLLDGIRAFTSGSFDKAIGEFKRVLATNPSGTVAVQCLYNTGICYLKMRLFKEADNQFAQIISRSPGHQLAINSLFLRGLCYLERSEPISAEKILRSFIQDHRKHPWAPNAYEKLGDAFIDMEQPKKAVDAYLQASGSAVRASDKVAMLFKLGKSYMITGNTQRAIESFVKVIGIGEKANVFERVPDSYYRIADEYYRNKTYDKALEYYQKATRKYPSFQETPWGLFQIGSIHKNTGKYQESIDGFKELIRRYPDDYWARQAQWKMDDAIWENEYKAVLGDKGEIH